MITFAEVTIGTGGVVTCGRCGRAPEPSPRSLASVAEELAQIARGWSLPPGPNVSFLGFEPFMHPQLPQLIAVAADEGCERIRLRTSGAALAQAGNAEGALHAGVRHLELVLLGDPATHDRLSCREGLCAATASGAAAFTAAASSSRVDVCVAGLVPVCPHNASILPEAVAALAAMGATSVCFDARAHRWRPAEEPLLRAALDTAALNRLAAFVRGPVPDRTEPSPAPVEVLEPAS